MAVTLSEQDEWDLAWAEFDHRAPAPARATVRSVAISGMAETARSRRARLRLSMSLGLPILAVGVNLAILGMQPVWPTFWSEPPRGTISLAPEEASLPPLAVSLARLRAESQEAACFAERLQPGSAGCSRGPAP